MTILLDTHVIIWALTNDRQLSSQARDMIADPDNMVFVSTASLWEIAVKNRKAPHLCPYHEAEIFTFCIKAGYLVMDIKPAHILAIRTLQARADRTITNQDPFDRLLIAQAKSEGCTLLSHDRNFENYDEECICTI